MKLFIHSKKKWFHFTLPDTWWLIRAVIKLNRVSEKGPLDVSDELIWIPYYDLYIYIYGYYFQFGFRRHILALSGSAWLHIIIRGVIWRLGIRANYLSVSFAKTCYCLSSVGSIIALLLTDCLYRPDMTPGHTEATTIMLLPWYN